MTDCEDAATAFVERAATVYEEYDQGYVDADAALRQLRPHLEDLEAALEGDSG